MIIASGLAWTFATCFAVLAIVGLIGLARSHGWVARVSYAAHILMCAGMVLMPVGWLPVVPTALWVALFTLAGLWYAWLALFRPHAAAGPGSGPHSGPLLHCYHVVMAVAMIWMRVLMAMMSTDGLSRMSGVPVGMHGMTGVRGMGGMADVPGPGAVSTGPAPTALWGLPPSAIVVSLVFVAAFAAAVIWFVVRLLAEPARPGRTSGLPHLVELLLGLAMAAGMGASFFLMA